ncbi:hypothetical protein F3K31_24340 (plasmid) [Escherichia coli]|nr:hypothetical protein F3K31_24340 [Escherichia coli]
MWPQRRVRLCRASIVAGLLRAGCKVR